MTMHEISNLAENYEHLSNHYLKQEQPIYNSIENHKNCFNYIT
uniref:Uncharacterized protein n=1 Tax=Rhizophora mucronata TaxID=61149 RepID=A0A2P2N870_RHIMU